LALQLPGELLQTLSSLDHFDREAFLSVHASGEQVVSIHLNPGKKHGGFTGQDTGEENDFLKTKERVPWAPDAYYLNGRPSFTLDPLFHAGCYYVQEASGMFLAHALGKIMQGEERIRVLDLCGAPGGKSTMIQSLLSADSLLVSNELIKTRVPVLVEQLTKWGYANHVVSNNDPSHFKRLPGFFDVLVVDAPCSGSGLFRRDPGAIQQWSTAAVNLCSQRQKRILADAWDCLREGGWLIYSTCSYSPEENEEILDFLLDNYPVQPVDLMPDPAWPLVVARSAHGSLGYRFYPDKVRGEGFFLSVLQKTAGESPAATGKKVYSKNRLPIPVRIPVEDWIRKEGSIFLTLDDGTHYIRESMAGDLETLRDALYLKKAGIRMGKAAGKDWIPDHELALANNLNNIIPSLDLGRDQALGYLRGSPTDTGSGIRGWNLVRYEKTGLGWVKVLEGRTNNYYPKSWRIRR